MKLNVMIPLVSWMLYKPLCANGVYWVIFDETDWFNNCPNDYLPRYRLISALSTSSPYTTTKPKPEVPFPGSKNITQYTPFAHNGLYNIQETNGIITFDFTTTTVQSGVEDITIDTTGIWYDLLGNVIDPTTYKGIVIHNKQKYILR